VELFVLKKPDKQQEDKKKTTFEISLVFNIKMQQPQDNLNGPVIVQQPITRATQDPLFNSPLWQLNQHGQYSMKSSNVVAKTLFFAAICLFWFPLSVFRLYSWLTVITLNDVDHCLDIHGSGGKLIARVPYSEVFDFSMEIVSSVKINHQPAANVLLMRKDNTTGMKLFSAITQEEATIRAGSLKQAIAARRV